ncbi:glutamine--fructose-6-phosphate transaminase (isomerizing) [Mycobacterium sp. ITM-2016-00317]|uniref:glutamine--fructose-6-phosphate transaminase (isomerizing) n=1 Tax=Mycobacterium sp. ITM-2016-00317 TaxID=2099694 RepID=UPI00287F51E1|nr:glutamine--fructose-6-phosphate transaminase (isomerizing) [Mycobacterium sp. ITM-2016-00317]WNG86977.1 glutamine--fructose-6-phosphate transaminase (isomerizing) [Mycobacterium sp. ITM-2016-00317]
MCGIIACRTHQPAVDYLKVGLRRLEYRGYDSVGVALQTADDDVVRMRTVGRIDDLDRMLNQWTGARFNGVGIGHTRWATHGSVTPDNAHPHADCTGEVSVVHNGIIENAELLRAELTCGGHVFETSVDSEVLCHLIEDERLVEDDLVRAVQKALARAQGSWALAVLEKASGRIAVAAHGSPLLVARTAHGDFATSDIAAVADWADEYRILEDGDIVELHSDTWLRSGVPITAPPAHQCRWRTSDVELHDHADFMAKEIDEQPEVASRLIERLRPNIADGGMWRQLGIPPFERLRVVGCGTSLNAGNVIANLVRSLGGLPVTTIVASEAGVEVGEPDQLSLAISQSGETADVLRALDTPAVRDARLVALTNNTHSTLARLSDAVVDCSAGPEIGVAATKTFICQVISGAALMISALVAMNRLSVRAANVLADDLCRIPDQLVAAGAVARKVIPPVADELVSAGGFIFIARGSGVPYAAEGALKLKELTYRWAEHCPAGELKHGPLALVGPGTPVIVVDNGDPKLPCNVAEVAARGGRVITIGAAGSSVPVIDDHGAPWGPVAATVPLQVLARTLALSLGRDVDKPRNLAKSVTVE